jgi:hypothetical protein
VPGDIFLIIFVVFDLFLYVMFCSFFFDFLMILWSHVISCNLLYVHDFTVIICNMYLSFF